MSGNRPREDWGAHLERLEQGDRASLLKLTRLVNGLLSRWNAYDFRDEWDDLIQEILIAGVQAQRDGRIRERGHTYGFLKTIARNKFVDRLKGHLRTAPDRTLPWEEVMETEAEPDEAGPTAELSHDLEQALAGLEERRRRCVLAVYVEGKTHPEAVEATGIPMGSLRRYLREGLAELQSRLAPGAARMRGGPEPAQGSARGEER